MGADSGREWLRLTYEPAMRKGLWTVVSAGLIFIFLHFING